MSVNHCHGLLPNCTSYQSIPPPPHIHKNKQLDPDQLFCRPHKYLFRVGIDTRHVAQQLIAPPPCRSKKYIMISMNKFINLIQLDFGIKKRICNVSLYIHKYINLRLFPMGVGRNHRTPPATILTSFHLVYVHTSGHTSMPVTSRYYATDLSE